MAAALDAIRQAAHQTALAHTTIYMAQAVALSEAFAFRRCEPFRTVPEEVRHTEISCLAASDQYGGSSLSRRACRAVEARPSDVKLQIVME